MTTPPADPRVVEGVGPRGGRQVIWEEKVLSYPVGGLYRRLNITDLKQNKTNRQIPPPSLSLILPVAPAGTLSQIPASLPDCASGSQVVTRSTLATSMD
jgi:hypothetical protein